MYSYKHFKSFSYELQIDLLNNDGIPLDLAYTAKNTEAALFAYHNFYVEVIVQTGSDEVLAVKLFKSTKRLEPYLKQVDISEITALLSCAK